MPSSTLPYLERRPTSYYFRRRFPHRAKHWVGNNDKSQKTHQTGFLCLSLRTQFLRDAKRIVHRLTAESDSLIALRTELDLPIKTEDMLAILKAVRDQEIRAHEAGRANAILRSPDAVSAALSREAQIQTSLRHAIATGDRAVAMPLLIDAAERLGIDL